MFSHPLTKSKMALARSKNAVVSAAEIRQRRQGLSLRASWQRSELRSQLRILRMFNVLRGGNMALAKAKMAD